MGILGGSFDPVHYGHLRVALEVSQKLNISTIKFIPCKQQVLKSHAPMEQTHRLNMLKLAVEGVSSFEVDERELKREGPSYMVETLQSLQQDYPEQTLCLILGADAAKLFEQWYHWRSIFALAHLIIVTRPHYDTTAISWLQAMLPERQVQHPSELKQAKAGKILLFSTSLLAISAEEIRRQLAERYSPKFLLPETVLSYIHQHHLYERI